jgi:hypothetical protein
MEQVTALYNLCIGLMAAVVDRETNCGREIAISTVKAIARGEYGTEEITPETSYNVVKLAIAEVKQREDNAKG